MQSIVGAKHSTDAVPQTSTPSLQAAIFQLNCAEQAQAHPSSAAAEARGVRPSDGTNSGAPQLIFLVGESGCGFESSHTTNTTKLHASPTERLQDDLCQVVCVCVPSRRVHTGPQLELHNSNSQSGALTKMTLQVGSLSVLHSHTANFWFPRNRIAVDPPLRVPDSDPLLQRRGHRETLSVRDEMCVALQELGNRRLRCRNACSLGAECLHCCGWLRVNVV